MPVSSTPANSTSVSLIPKEPIWVDNSATLAELCQRWSQQAAIAIDTEFMRTSTFYPIAALFQVGDGQGCYLLDPLAIDDFSPFAELMQNPAVIKVFHSCSEDFEVFQAFMNVTPKPIFDTQTAAALAGYGFSLGYAKLVQALMGVEMAKSETRSDWLQRPLSASQLNYAALDVAYLLVVYGLLVKRLREQQRLTWVEEDCAELVRLAEQSVDVDAAYQKVKQAWKLKPQQLAILQNLARWRELEARSRDLPRNRLLKERAMWDMARYQPDELKQLRGLEGMTPRMIQNDGETWLELIAEGLSLAPEQWPAALPAPLPPEQTALLKALKKHARHIAEQLELPPEVLVRKKDYEALVRSGMQAGGQYRLSDRLSGWRKAVVGEPLLAVANDF